MTNKTNITRSIKPRKKYTNGFLQGMIWKSKNIPK